MLNEKEVLGMCQKLARKYNNKNEYDDLVSEGTIVCLSLLQEDPKTHPAKLYREAKRRMHDYLNIETLPVFIPAHNVAKRIARDAETEFYGEMSEASAEWIKLIMTSEGVTYEEDFSQSAEDQASYQACALHAQVYEDREFEAHMLSVAVTTLNPTEWAVIKMRYFNDMTQDEVASAMETNQKWVSRHEISALEKLRTKLL